MVVECPSCKTKFAVDPELIKGVSCPRFHCSRCDHFFEGMPKEELVGAEPQGAQAVHSDFGATHSATPAQIPLPLDKRPIDFSSTNATEFSFSSDTDAHSLEYDGDVSSAPISPQLFLDDLEQETEKDEDIAVKKGVLVPWPGQVQNSSIRPQSTSIGQHSISAFHTDLSMLSDRGKSFRGPKHSDSTPLPESTWSFGDSVSSEAALLEDEQSAPPEPLRQRDFLPKQFSEDSRMTSTQEVYSLRSVGMVLSLPLAFLACLASISLFHVLPHGHKWIPDLLPFQNSSQLVPPVNLTLNQLTGKTLSLENGTRVFEVQGRLSNLSDKTLQGIIIETLAFNSSGQKIYQLRTPAESQMDSSRAESLSVETIESLSKQAHEKAKPLEPGESRPVRILLATLPEDAVNFSSRVYSVTHREVDHTAHGSRFTLSAN